MLSLLLVALAAVPRAEAATWSVFDGEVRKGDVHVMERNGLSLVSLNDMMTALDLPQNSNTSGISTTVSGKKLEFWSGSNVARVSGRVSTFPHSIFAEGGHWWGEANAALSVMGEFAQSLGRTVKLRWSKGEAPSSALNSGSVVAPALLAGAYGSGPVISGVRWGLQGDAHRAVVDLTGETQVTLKELAGAVEIEFTDATIAGIGAKRSPWPPLAVESKKTDSGVALTFTHNAARVKGFWLTSPPRYVVDFFFAGTSGQTPLDSSTPPTVTPGGNQTPTNKINTVPSTTVPGTTQGGTAKSSFLVVIDAGHGGHDPGAVGNGLKEKDINLKASLQLMERLKKLGIDVKLTRGDDRYLKLAERTAFANKADADIFISLHCNALPKGKHASGIELYLMAEPSDKDAMSLAVFENRELSGQGDGEEATAASDQKTRLLLKILGDMQQNDKISESTIMAEYLYKRALNLGLSLRKVRQAPFFVLRGAGMPSVLVEMGYISEKSDANLLNSEAYRGKLMDGLAAGIVEYLRRPQKGGGR